MTGKRQRQLERFFAEVAPRLDTAQTLDDELDRQLARRFNVFRYLRTDEIGFSKMIADLLDPTSDHGQGAAFLQLLIEKLAATTTSRDFAKDTSLARARVQTERHIEIDGRRRQIDISVEIDSKRGFAIESKSNNAGDQEGQVEDYLSWLEREYSHSSMLIYLSPTGDGPSEVSVARETIKALDKTEAPRRLVIMPCDSSDPSNDEFDNLRLPFSLVDWLADCRRNCDVDRLRWYLREAEMYCRQRYGENIMTDSKKTAVADFVRGSRKNVATALAIYETWPEVACKIKCGFLRLIWNELPDELLGHGDWHWGYNDGQGRFESYIFARRKCWRPYLVDGQERFTELYLQANSKESSNWYIGVYSPAASSVSKGGRERREELHEELGKLGKNQYPFWPYWEWVNKEYRDWNALSPELNEELREGGGEIADYFYKKFEEVASQVTPIIDSIEGADRRG